MRCSASSRVQDDITCCTSEATVGALCFYHDKMSRGAIEPQQGNLTKNRLSAIVVRDRRGGTLFTGAGER